MLWSWSWVNIHNISHFISITLLIKLVRFFFHHINQIEKHFLSMHQILHCSIRSRLLTQYALHLLVTLMTFSHKNPLVVWINSSDKIFYYLKVSIGSCSFSTLKNIQIINFTIKSESLLQIPPYHHSRHFFCIFHHFVKFDQVTNTPFLCTTRHFRHIFNIQLPLIFTTIVEELIF